LNFSIVYLFNLCSISSIFLYHHIFSIYSNAFNKLIAQLRFGVPGSNLSGSPASLKHVSFTQDIAHHHEKAGLRLLSNSSFHHNIHIQESDISLCHVKNKASHHISFTSTLR